MTTTSEKYFTFQQNNSGGFFTGPNYIIIRAESLSDACEKAQRLTSFFPSLDDACNVYFNGVDDELDCPCCGDRWSEHFVEDGTDVPMIYDTPVQEYLNGFRQYPPSVIIAEVGEKKSLTVYNYRSDNN